eukprot:9318623-Prorocentrum_lima.AAC.1
MSLTKAWWMKNFLHLHGTTLKPGPNSESRDLKKKAKGISGMKIEAHAIPERDWSRCNKEQVLTQLEALSQKKLVTYAKT